jgi:excisionase family DNA binding protein
MMSSVTEANPFAPLAKMIADMVVDELDRRQKRLLTPKEAAKYMNRSLSWLRAEAAAGRIECVREGKSRTRFDRAVLDRWIQVHNGRD